MTYNVFGGTLNLAQFNSHRETYCVLVRSLMRERFIKCRAFVTFALLLLQLVLIAGLACIRGLRDRWADSWRPLAVLCVMTVILLHILCRVNYAWLGATFNDRRRRGIYVKCGVVFNN